MFASSLYWYTLIVFSLFLESDNELLLYIRHYQLKFMLKGDDVGVFDVAQWKFIQIWSEQHKHCITWSSILGTMVNTIIIYNIT